MEINPDPSMQRCLGLGRATGTAGADIGGKVVGMLNQLSEMLLAKSVVGEEFEIDTKQIKIFAAKVSGEGAKEPFDILDTGVSFDLPDSFCLEKMEDGVCRAPIGISAIVFKNNPRVKIDVPLFLIHHCSLSLMPYSLAAWLQTRSP